LFVVELSLDYENQLHTTDLIVIITIIVILILVYRSPLLPLIQIFVLAIAFGVSRLTFIFIGSRIGGLSNTSLIVLSVSLLGATTDYCVFLMGDYLLNLKKTNSREKALRMTLKRTSKSIVISSISLTVGFGALVLSSFAMATGMGIGGMIGFITSMLVSLSLIPAVLILINEKYLTKWRFSFKKLKLPKFSLTKGVRRSVKNPKIVLAAAVVVALIGTGIFLITPMDYAHISTAPTSYQSRQGLDSVNTYLGTEYISRITLLFQTPETDNFLFSNGSFNYNSVQHVLFIAQELIEAANITQIVGLSHPLGIPFTESLQNTSLFVSEEIFILMKNFILPDESLGLVYLGSQYMEGDERLNNQVVIIRESVQQLMEEREITDWDVYVTGFASQMYDSKETIQHDFNLIFAFTCITIAVLIFLFLRDFFMSIRVLITILMSLGFSLGIFAILALIFFGGSIYWMVPLMLYAVLTALGLDFDVLFLGIFLNIYEETKDKQKAMVSAVEQTMSNISVAGIIMAATYLSLVFTSSIHMQQLGLGLGIGILVDVFVSRLFIVPPAVVVSFRPKEERKKKKGEVNDEGGKK
jgi:RND superfamily putative drug exporter